MLESSFGEEAHTIGCPRFHAVYVEKLVRMTDKFPLAEPREGRLT